MNLDPEIVKLLNSGVGHVGWWDGLVEILVSDYLIPVLASLVLFGLWFWGTGQKRAHNQLITMIGAGTIGLTNLATSLVNNAYFRDRPFVDLDLTVLFYHPTDSSFPSNAPALVFAVATVVSATHRRLGLVMFGLALVYGFFRVYAGLHYPTDILAGGIIGVIASIMVLAVARVCLPMVQLFLKAIRWGHLA